MEDELCKQHSVQQGLEAMVVLLCVLGVSTEVEQSVGAGD